MKPGVFLFAVASALVLLMTSCSQKQAEPAPINLIFETDLGNARALGKRLVEKAKSHI